MSTSWSRRPDDDSRSIMRNGEYKQKIMCMRVSELKIEGIERARRVWGSDITHLVFFTPSHHYDLGPDYHLTVLLGSPHSVRPFPYQKGCYNEGTVLQIFWDFASRRLTKSLVVCSEIRPVRSGGISN